MAAFVDIKVEKLDKEIKGPSNRIPKPRGPSIVRIGTLGNTRDPSCKAYIFIIELFKVFSQSKNSYLTDLFISFLCKIFI